MTARHIQDLVRLTFNISKISLFPSLASLSDCFTSNYSPPFSHWPRLNIVTVFLYFTLIPTSTYLSSLVHSSSAETHFFSHSQSDIKPLSPCACTDKITFSPLVFLSPVSLLSSICCRLPFPKPVYNVTLCSRSSILYRLHDGVVSLPYKQDLSQLGETYCPSRHYNLPAFHTIDDIILHTCTIFSSSVVSKPSWDISPLQEYHYYMRTNTTQILLLHS